MDFTHCLQHKKVWTDNNLGQIESKEFSLHEIPLVKNPNIKLPQYTVFSVYWCIEPDSLHFT